MTNMGQYHHVESDRITAPRLEEARGEVHSINAC